MIMDLETLFSDQQAITASAASTNVIDLGVARDIGKGKPIPLLIQVTEAFNNLTTLEAQIQTDDNSGFSSAKTVATTGAVALADLVAGWQSAFQFVPNGVAERYVRLNFVVVGTAPTTGKVTAGVTMGNQTN